MLTLMLSEPGAIVGWVLTALCALWAMRTTLQRSEARGDAAEAELGEAAARGAQAKAERERDESAAAVTAIRAQLEATERARKLAVDEASELRRRLEAAAVPGSVAGRFDEKFGAGS